MIGKIFKNFQYKIFAVILAAVAWYIVQAKEILEIEQRIQVSLIVPDGFTIDGPTTRIKDATIKGSRVFLSEMKSDHPIEARIYLPKTSGNIRVLLSKQHLLNLNEQVDINILDPYMNISIDERYAKSISIKEHLKGVPAEGHMIEKAIIKPNTVMVSGLKAQVNRISEVLTEAIDVNGLQGNRSFEVELQNDGNNKINYSVDKVTVTLQVGEKKTNKRFSSIPIELEGSKYNITYKPRFASIVVQGAPGALNFVKREELRAFLDVRDLAPGKYEKKLNVQIPSNTVLIETFPETVEIEVAKTLKK